LSLAVDEDGAVVLVVLALPSLNTLLQPKWIAMRMSGRESKTFSMLEGEEMDIQSTKI
jgi:hypothetical protein